MSTSITQRSGTLLSASPPRMRPRLIEGRSNRSELSRANGSDSIARKASSAFRIALSPSQGVAPCAAVPLTSSRIASTPFACTPTWRSVGSPVIAKSPVKPCLIRNVGAAVDLLLGLLVGHDREHDAHVLLVAQLLERAHHRGQRALHVVGAAAQDAVALDPRLELLRAGRHDVQVAVQDHRRAPARSPRARPARGRPRISSSSTGMSRDSSQPLTNPAALRMPSSLEVS